METCAEDRRAIRRLPPPRRGLLRPWVGLLALLVHSACGPAIAGTDGTWVTPFGPMARITLASTYDPVEDRLIMVGGYAENEAIQGDVWGVSLEGGSSWFPMPTLGDGPGPRRGHAVAYDPVRRRLLLYGGSNSLSASQYALAGVWALPLEGAPVWARLTTGPGPPGRVYHSLVYDPPRDRLILVGGVDSGATVPAARVWALSLSGPMNWVQLPLAPSEFVQQSASYDAVHDRLVVLGARNAEGTHYEWVLPLGGGSGWSLTPFGPTNIPGRDAPAATYDPVGERMFVYGGQTPPEWTARSDTWVYSPGPSPGWIQLTSAGTEPGPRVSLSSFYDPVRDRMVMLGGTWGTMDVWALPLTSGSAWQRVVGEPLEPPGLWEHESVFDPIGRQMMFHGGDAGDSLFWTLSLSGVPQWSSVAVAGSPTVKGGGIVVVFDSNRQRLLAHGGSPAEVWSISPGPTPAWTRIDPANALPHEWKWHQGIFDPVRDRLLVFGGHLTTCQGNHCQISTYFREVWALSFSGTPTWSQVAVQGDPPPPLRGASVIYDPVRDRMIIFGGSALISPYGNPGRAWALTLAGVPTWSVLAEPTSIVLQRDGQSAVYDATRDRMVVHGGEGGGTSRSDTWALELGGTPTWHELHPTGVELGRRWEHGAVYDPFLDRMIVHAGYPTSTTLVLEWGGVPTGVRPRTQDPPSVGLRPVANPSTGELRFAIQLRRAGHAVLEVFDLAGRRLARRELTAEPGLHDVAIPDPGGRSGVILARLTQSGESAVARVIRLR